MIMLVLAATLLAACQVAPPSDGPVTTAPGDALPPDTTLPETTVPDTTVPDTNPPGETTPPNGEDTTEAPAWLLILVGLGIVILITVFVTRGSKKKIVVAPVPPNWKDHARSGYAGARWLYDAMGEDMAVWRGNAQFEGATSAGSTAATSKAETWEKLNDRMISASDALYALEAAAPDRRSAEAARNTVTTMRGVRDALDARAESRYAYRTVQGSGPTSEQLIDAREREVRSSRNLVEARNAFAKSLTDLSTIV